MPTPQGFTEAQTQPESFIDLIVADVTSPEILELVQGAKAPAFPLDNCAEPLQVITTVVAGSHLETLHIVAHGRGGRWWLGGQIITERTLRDNAHLFQHWNVDRIALWICEAGIDRRMVDLLARLTGAEVLASTGRLGREPRSGLRHWQLPQAGGGGLHGCAVFDMVTLDMWPHQLATSATTTC